MRNEIVMILISHKIVKNKIRCKVHFSLVSYVVHKTLELIH